MASRGIHAAEETSSGSNIDQSKSEAVSSKETSGAWIRYCLRVLGTNTNRLIKEEEISDPDFNGIGSELEHDTKKPVLEKVTTYKVDDSKDSSKKDVASEISASTLAVAHPTHHIEIFSVGIINALRRVVQYYPQQDLTRESVVVEWPYPILVHHYRELSQYRDNCKDQSDTDHCIRDRYCHEHLDLLLQFLDKEVMAEVNAEEDRFRRGARTWNWGWVMWRPGSTIITRYSDEKNQLYTRVVHSISGGIFENPPKAWKINTWSLSFDGEFLGREQFIVESHKYDGEGKVKDFRPVDMDRDSEDPDVIKHVENGEKYWQLLQKACQYHTGRTKSFPFNEASQYCLIVVSLINVA